MNKWKWMLPEFILSFVIPFLVCVIGALLRIYFGNNAFPVDYDIIDSYDWADIFFRVSLILVGWGIFYNLIIMLIGAKFDKHSQIMWVIYAAIAFMIGIALAVVMNIFYREDSGCTIIMYIYFILGSVSMFALPTLKCPKHWDFVPFI